MRCIVALGHERSSSTESLQHKIVNALRFGERHKASGLLSELGRRSEPLKDADFLLILKDCARLPDPLVCLRVNLLCLLYCFDVSLEEN